MSLPINPIDLYIYLFLSLLYEVSALAFCLTDKRKVELTPQTPNPRISGNALRTFQRRGETSARAWLTCRKKSLMASLTSAGRSGVLAQGFLEFRENPRAQGCSGLGTRQGCGLMPDICSSAVPSRTSICRVHVSMTIWKHVGAALDRSSPMPLGSERYKT